MVWQLMSRRVKLTTTFFLFLKLLSETGLPFWSLSLKSGGACPTDTILNADELMPCMANRDDTKRSL